MPPPQPVTKDKAMFPGERRPVRGASVLHALAPILHRWLWRQLHSCGPRKMLELGGENSQGRASFSVPGKNSPAAQPVSTQLPCSGSLSQGLPFTSVSSSHLSFGLFCYLLSSREMYLEEPSLDAVAEPPSLLVLQSERRL